MGGIVPTGSIIFGGGRLPMVIRGIISAGIVLSGGDAGRVVQLCVLVDYFVIYSCYRRFEIFILFACFAFCHA